MNNQSGVPTPIPTPASEAEQVCECGHKFFIHCDDGSHCLESDGKDYCPCDKFAVAPPSTEESGEPIDVARDSITVTDKHYEDARKLLKSHAKADLLNVIAISGALYEFWLGSKSTPASETSDYLRGKLDEGGEPMEMARSGAAIRKMHDDLFFVDWGNVRFGTTLKGLADLGHDLGLYVSRQLKRGA